MKNHYIQAIIELIQSDTDPEKIIDGLRNVIQNKGHMRLYSAVMCGVLRILETEKATAVATVVVAKDSDIQKYANVIETALSSIRADPDFSTEIDETIIGGVIIKNNNTIVDRSYKTTLTNLYRSTTK